MTQGPKIIETRRVLVIDDDPIYLQIWDKVLRGIPGCQYTLTNDNASVRAILENANVDLVISDVVMLGMNGFDIAQLVNEHQANADVLLTTGFDCNLEKFDLNNPRFHILYKPYRDIFDIQKLITHLLQHNSQATLDTHDASSPHDLAPSVTEWRL